MRFVKNEIIKNMSLVKLAVIILFMILISFATIESRFEYSAEYELLSKSTTERNGLEKYEKKYEEESTTNNLYFVYFYKLNNQIEEIQNNIEVYHSSWKEALIIKIKDMHSEIAILQMIKDGIDPSTFNLGDSYKYYTSEEVKEELESKDNERQEYIDLLVNGTYDDFTSKEIKDLEEEIAISEDVSVDDANAMKVGLNKELIKIKKYIVDNSIKDDQNARVEAQKKLEELVYSKDYTIKSKDDYNKNYSLKKTYGKYDDYLYHIESKAKRIDEEYQRLWYAMENGIEITNSTKNVVDKFWQFSFILAFGIVILFATIISKEYKSGSIRLLLTQGVKRYKILLSKYLAIIISTYVLYLLFLFIYLFIACLKGSFNELLTPEIITIFGKTITINYFANLFIEILISGLPTIFIITVVFLITTIRESAILGSVIGMILSLSTLFIEWMTIFIIMLKWHFLRYLPTSYLNLPSFKYSDYFLDNSSPLFHILDYNLGIVILLSSIIILYVITHLVFVNKDIRN